MDRKHVIYQQNNTVQIINENGEVTETQKTSSKIVKLPKEPNFVKLYFDQLGVAFGVSKGLSPILLKLVEFATYANKNDKEGGMLLYLNKPLKERIAEDLNVSVKRIENAITQFVKSNYMRRIERGAYQFNPALFGKGDWSDIGEIRAIYSYKAGTLEVNFERD